MILVRRIVPIALALTLGWPAVSAHAATCSDYSNQAEAQRAADTRDADGDGIYCESLPCPCSSAAGGGGSTPTHHAPAAPAVRCGKERWNVKTTQDKRSNLINLTPKRTTVGELRKLPDQHTGSHTPRISAFETTVFRVRAQLVSAKVEEDGDIHLVIAQLNDRKKTMIVELPNKGCLQKTGAKKRAKIVAARNALVRACGTPSASKFTTLHGKATIDGVGFFDVKHGTPQRGVAPNNIELHPVLRFAATSSCTRG